MRQAVRWFVAFIVVFLVTGLAGEVFISNADLPVSFTTTMLALNVIGAASISFTLLALFARERNEALEALRAEQEKSELLVLNILPRPIAERLKVAAEPIADHLPAVSIVFADVVDFTPLAQRLPPAEMVRILDHLFSDIDMLVERHGLEKIKTIGDCYMAAAGVPNQRPDHARKAALLALDMREVLATSAVDDQPGLELRIGINSGPVVAGVIGKKRFLYDLWGDAVNTASRMESHGTPGEIQITRATYELVKDEFDCRPRGTIDVKGKGPMETWYLVRSRSPGGAVVRAQMTSSPGARPSPWWNAASKSSAPSTSRSDAARPSAERPPKVAATSTPVRARTAEADPSASAANSGRPTAASASAEASSASRDEVCVCELRGDP